MLGNSGAARAASEKAALIFEQRGDARRLVTVQLNLVQQDLTEDALDRAEVSLEEARRTASTFRDGHINSSIRRLEAMLLIERGDYGNARSQLLRVYRSRLRAGDLPMAQVAAQNITRLTHDVRGAEASLRWWRTALDLADKTREIEQQLLARRGLAKALLEHGDNAEAIAHLKVLADRHDDLGMSMKVQGSALTWGPRTSRLANRKPMSSRTATSRRSDQFVARTSLASRTFWPRFRYWRP